MPSIELVEREKVAYINEMKEYLHSLKTMSEKDAQKVSRENLIRSGILQENGELAEHYRSKLY